MFTDLLLRILEDAKEFDTRTWIAAVAIGELTMLQGRSLFTLQSHPLIVLIALTC